MARDGADNDWSTLNKVDVLERDLKSVQDLARRRP